VERTQKEKTVFSQLQEVLVSKALETDHWGSSRIKDATISIFCNSNQDQLADEYHCIEMRCRFRKLTDQQHSRKRSANAQVPSRITTSKMGTSPYPDFTARMKDMAVRTKRMIWNMIGPPLGGGGGVSVLMLQRGKRGDPRSQGEDSRGFCDYTELVVFEERYGKCKSYAVGDDLCSIEDRREILNAFIPGVQCIDCGICRG
jgi:hypothetical protein